jgi:hypothetical protein
VAAISLTISQRIFLVIALLMLVWYVLGLWYSRRQSIRTLNWLREGLDSLGGQTHASWIGSAASGARIVVSTPRPPFRQLEVTYLLESRELLPLWLANLLRGKRDEIFIRALLCSPQQGVVEVVSPGSHIERSLREDSQTSWHWGDGPRGLRVAYRGSQGETLSAAITSFLQRYSLYLHRFSYRKDQPHLLIHARLAGLMEQSPVGFFEDLAAVFNHPGDA